MKNLIKSMLLCSFLLALVVSCDKKDDEISDSMLIGKWKAVSMELPADEDGYGGWFVSYEDGLDDLYYEFKSDGTCGGNVGIIEIIPEEGNWVLDNGELTIGESEFVVAKLDANNLYIRRSYGDDNYIEIKFKRVED